MTLSLSSSVEVLSQSSRWADDSASDDEIVWSLADSGELSVVSSKAVPGSPRSDDFILISRPASPSPVRVEPQVLADAFAALSLSPVTSTAPRAPRRKPRAKKPTSPSSPTAPAQTVPKATQRSFQPSPSKRSKKKSRSRSSSLELAKSVTDSYPSPPSSPAQNRTTAKHAATTSLASPPNSKPNSKKAKKQTPALAAGVSLAKVQTESTGLGERTVVDDVSELPEDDSPVYNEARDYMSKYLANPPPPGNNGSALLLCQALIIELGINPASPKSLSKSSKATPSYFSNPNLPKSLRQAKMLLKSQAFINIRDYLAQRDHGPAALRNVMHASRKSLVKDIRRTPGKRAPLAWVKETGLNVLLVNTRF